MTTKSRIVAFGWLQPFSGEEKKCPKCRTEGSKIHFFYHPTVVVGECKEIRDSVVALADDAAAEVPDEMTEHLCCACTGCGYSWSERTADAQG
jgi:hypothetical protein